MNSGEDPCPPDRAVDEGTTLFHDVNAENLRCPGIEFELESDDQESGVERSTWANGFDFVLSLLGYAVGLGNLWRFPYLCMRNGGGAFLIPFLICLVTCGLPLFLMEIAAGQFSGKGTLDVWAVCPLFKGIGIGMALTSSVVSTYYNVILAWGIYYMASSFKAVLPWTRCDGWWNTKNCVVQGHYVANTTVSSHNNSSSYNDSDTYNSSDSSNGNLSSASVNMTGNTSYTTSEEEFWQYNALQMSGGLDETGTIPWYLALCFVAAWLLVFLCICKGVRSIGKVVYVTALLPYILLLILLIRGATLPGAWDGIVYYLYPDLDRMMTTQVWIEAALQVFYSLGPGWGPLISMASFNRFNNNVLKDALFITFVGEGTSIFSGLVVFTILGFISHDLGIPIADVAKSGT